MDLTIDLQACRKINNEIVKHLQFVTKSMMELDMIIIDLKTIDDSAIQIIVANLRKKRQKLEDDIKKLRMLSTALEQIVYQYERTERKIEDYSIIQVIEARAKWIWPASGILIRALPMPNLNIIAKYFN